jgi:hypothetical protein
MKKIFARIFRQKSRVKVEIICPHGAFIPGVYAPGKAPRRFGCDRCEFRVTLSTFSGEVDW